MSSVSEILATKYPAKAHARRVAESLQTRHGEVGVIYLEAQKTRLIEDNDEPMPFRYESKLPCLRCSYLIHFKDNVALSSI